MDADEFLEPCDEAPFVSRGPTERSMFAEKLLVRFIASGVLSASVAYEKSPWTLKELYSSLYAMSNKKAFKQHVMVKKKNGRIVLFRK